MPVFPRSRRDGVTPDARVRAAIDAHYDSIWRFLRRLGVRAADAEDAAQKVFVILAGRLGDVAPKAERSFLFSTALRVASDFRKRSARSREDLAEHDLPANAQDPGPSADEAIDDRRMRRWLDEILSGLADEHREVLVLVDIEGETMSTAAAVLGIPPGTVASRLRRARELFEAAAEELKKRISNDAGGAT